MASLSRISGPRSLASSSGSPSFQLAHARQQQLGEFPVDGVLDQNALHGNAGLSGVGKASCNAAVGGVCEIGIAVNDDARIAAQFENDFFLPRVVLDGPTDSGAAGETDELDALIGDQQSGIFVREQKRIESAIGPSRLLNHFRQQQRGERRLRRGLEHHGTAGGNGRRDFVGDQIQREIKRRDAGDGTERKPFDDAPTPGSRLLPIQRQIFAIAANRFFGGNIEGENGAVHFAAGALDGLARFERNGAGKFFFALVDAGRNLAQNALAFEGRQPRVVPKALTAAAMAASACSRRPW
jgi:hypothetical protein